MTSSLGGSGRRCRGLTDIVPQYDDSQSDKISNGSSEGDQRTSINGIKIQHLTSSCAVGHSRFPKLEECAHFHYEHVELNSLQVSLYEEEDLKSLSSLECNENSENKWLTVKVSSQGQSWLLRRTYENFRMLDQQLHQCIYDRKFSTLPELPPLENLPEKQDPQTYIKCHLSRYCERFSDIAGNLINCGPVLSWLQLDNRGRRILVTDGDSCPINTPGVAAAYAVKKYTAVAADEISFDVGDMISVIDMPPPEDSIWWRGKRGFMVGFFPSYCVAVITDKVPRNLQLNQPSTIIEPSKPVLRKHGKLIAFFRAFILSRPSKRHLKQSGILKERVFGCDLGEHLLNSGRDVPMVLKCCSEFIEQHGIVDGIYRLSGATSNIQKLRTTFDEDRIPALYNDDSILQDIHSVASLLKMYFRELPNPLCTYQLYKNFVHAVQNADPTERVAMMRDVVQKLPPPHFRTLEFLMRHLSRVAEHGTRTGMTARNIAIVWAPNLLRCKELEFGGVAALQGVGVQAVVTEFLISNVDLVFSNDHHSFHGTAKRVRPKSLSLGTPTKLLSLEEAQSKKLGLESSHDNYIEVGGGPACLPKIYHTVIELPHRKRVPLKRSPLGWKSFFSRSSSGSTGLRKSSSTNSGKRKTSTSTEISYKLPESSKKPEPDVKSRLRSVKSAESLISGAGNSASVRNSVCLEYLSPPSPKLSGTAGHSRSVSHDSYFDHLAESTPIHSTIRQDEEGLSDLQVNFDLDESEMKIFSEESSQLFSNTSSSEHVQSNLKKIPILASAENTIIVDPSPKKHKTSDSSSCSSATLSDDMTAVSNKRSRLEERLLNEDFAYIDSQCDRLVVEVDVHHRESSHLSSPMTDTAYSENDTILSGCTMSDSMTTTNNVMYTPLSECSYTTSSMYEPSYQPLSSSMSSSHLPRSSTESIRTSELKKYENVPRNRFSYQGDLRPGITMRNRLSLQTLNSHTVHDCHRDSVSSNSVCENRLNGEVTKYDVSCSKTQLLNEKLPDKCDDAFVKWHQKSVCGNETADENNFGDEPSTLSNDRLQWNSNDDGAHCILSNSSSASTESEQNSRYENVQKLELILNDKEMFSEPSKFSSPANESPYELVTMVGNRMTSVSADENTEFLKNNKTPTESNYEEVRPVSPNQLHHPLKTTIPTICAAGYGNYEEMSSEYAENEIYNFEGSLARSEKKSNYEEISLLDDDISDLRALSSSNESLESSVDEAMVENNLYESLVAEDSSPDPGSNLSSRTADNGIAFTSRRSEDIPLYKNIIVTTDVSNKESDETLLTETNPLLISDTQSSYSDTEPPQFCKSPTKNVQSAEQMSPSGVNSRNFVEKISRKDDQLQDVNQPLTLSVAAEEMIISNCDTQPNDIKSPHSDRIVEKNDQNMPDLSSSGYAKSVQDLVSKFEWSAENDPLKKDPPIYRSKTTSQMQTTMDKTEYFSLPPVLVKRLSEDSFCNAIEMAGDDKEDESVRRDRIEKYKEERRLALRQKYQVDDSLNDKKDEEMIRRFKQKIMKNEKIDSKNRIEFDSSPNDDVVLKNEHLLAKENYDKLPTSVTTISILYTSRKKRDSVEDDSPRLKSAEEKRNESQSPGAHGALSKCPEPQISCEIDRTCLKNNGNADSSMSKSFSSVAEQSRDWPLKSADGKRPFTSSLERKMKSFVREESLVAKRVNQLSEASELSETSHSKRNGETGSMRQRAHSTSGPIAPYCIRDIAAIFENKDNNK